MLSATLLASALLTALTGLARLPLLLLTGLLAAALLATLLATLLTTLLLLARLARLLIRILAHFISFQLLAGSKCVFDAPRPNALNNVPRKASFPRPPSPNVAEPPART